MRVFVNISNSFKWDFIYITRHFVYHIRILEMIVLHVSTQGKNMIEPTNGKRHVFTFKYVGGRYP